MKVLELFSGTKSISKAFEAAGHEVFIVDNNEELQPDLCIDINKFDQDMCPFKPDIIWASPPCTHFSVANLGRHWTNGIPMTAQALRGIEMVLNTMELIRVMKPKYFFIENPMGMLRKMPFMTQYIRKEVTYCQYGDTRRKPTDIWTNIESWTPKKCKNGSKCHDRQPRGYKKKLSTGAIGKGTQGIKTAKDRGIIPATLCEEIVQICENNTSTTAQKRLTP